LAKKFYVVWKGRKTGIFTDWNTCKAQVDKFEGARFKSFPTLEEAEVAFGSRAGGVQGDGAKDIKPKRKPTTPIIETLDEQAVMAIAVDTKIFADGACVPNPGKAGSGIAIYRDNQVSELWFGLYNPIGTNNTAELGALYRALMIAATEIAGGSSAAIFSDSKYSIQCITQWAPGWEKRGWTKANGEIKNLDIIKVMHDLYQSLKDKLQIHHVNGHVGVLGNELADRMSVWAIDSQETDWQRYLDPIDIEQILSMRKG
jgi:ribonuclease HI